jgi:hypothetical protein
MSKISYCSLEEAWGNSYSIKIIDFDLVSSIGETLYRGTPQYMCHSNKKTIISDIYSLSLVFLDLINIHIVLDDVILLAQHYVLNREKRYIPKTTTTIKENYFKIKEIMEIYQQEEILKKKIFNNLIKYILFEMTFHYPKKNKKSTNYSSDVDYQFATINNSIVTTFSCGDIIPKLESIKGQSLVGLSIP